jgi:hypothetical protein
MENAQSETYIYCGVEIRVVSAGERTLGYCPFCDHIADVETGFFPKFGAKLAAGWIRHHLEMFHPALLD